MKTGAALFDASVVVINNESSVVVVVIVAVPVISVLAFNFIAPVPAGSNVRSALLGEAIVEPRKYNLNTNFIDMESHPSMSLDWSWGNHRFGPDKVYEQESFTGSFSENADGI